MRLPGSLRLRIAQTTSSSVKSGCSSISVSKKVVYFSSGEVLPPRGLAAQLPVVRYAATHLIAELALTSTPLLPRVARTRSPHSRSLDLDYQQSRPPHRSLSPKSEIGCGSICHPATTLENPYCKSSSERTPALEPIDSRRQRTTFSISLKVPGPTVSGSGSRRTGIRPSSTEFGDMANSDATASGPDRSAAHSRGEAAMRRRRSRYGKFSRSERPAPAGAG